MNTGELDDLPEGWEASSIADVTRRVQYGTSSKPTDDAQGIPVLRMSNIQDGSLDLSRLKYLAETESGISNLILQPGDILFNRTNSPELVGKAALFRSDLRATFASYLIRLQLNELMVVPEFVSNWINSPWGRGWARFVRTDGVSQSNINSSKLLAMPLPLPPLAEQRRIVSAVEAVRAKVNAAHDRLKQVSAILKRFRQSVLSAACSGRLTVDWREMNSPEEPASIALSRVSEVRREWWEQLELARLRAKGKVPNDESWKRRYSPGCPPNRGEGNELPEDWEWATVSQVARLDVGFAFKSSEFTDRGIRLLRGENLEPGALRWLDVRHWPEEKLEGLEHLLIEVGEIILALDRPVISTGLKLARAKPCDLPCLLVQRMMRFKMVDPALTDYLYLCLQTPSFLASLHDSTTGSDLPHITGTGVAEFTFPFPPLAEQREIVRRVGELFALADTIETRLADAQRMVDQIIQAVLVKAFRGELVATEADLARREGRIYESAGELLHRLRSLPASSSSRSRVQPPKKNKRAPRTGPGLRNAAEG